MSDAVENRADFRGSLHISSCVVIRANDPQILLALSVLRNTPTTIPRVAFSLWQSPHPILGPTRFDLGGTDSSQVRGICDTTGDSPNTKNHTTETASSATDAHAGFSLHGPRRGHETWANIARGTHRSVDGSDHSAKDCKGGSGAGYDSVYSVDQLSRRSSGKSGCAFVEAPESTSTAGTSGGRSTSSSGTGCCCSCRCSSARGSPDAGELHATSRELHATAGRDGE